MSFSRAVTVQKRGQHTQGRQCRAVLVNQGASHVIGLTGAVERGQTADALGQQILAGALEVWTVRSISGAGTIDQLRIDGAERLIGVSQLFHDARTEVLHHHIGAFHQLIK